MIVIGLTGQVATGKSMFARFGKRFGGIHIDTDSLARKLYHEPDIKREVINLLGRETFMVDGSLNKSYIFRKLFFEDGYKSQLESILYPRLVEKVQAELERLKNKNGFVLLEAVNLFVSGLDRLCDFKVCLVSSCEDQIARMEAKGMSLPAALAVIVSQPGVEYYRKRCDYLLINQGTLKEFEKLATDFFIRISDVRI